MKAKNVATKLIESHLVSGTLEVGTEIGIRIDQTLTQDATGTIVMLELEAMGLDRVQTEVSVQYVDHNLLQADFKNADDHLFLRSACRRFGVWYSRPGNGVSHPLHQERFGRPGKTLLGADSHTCAAGAIGMLAIGAGGLEVALSDVEDSQDHGWRHDSEIVIARQRADLARCGVSCAVIVSGGADVFECECPATPLAAEIPMRDQQTVEEKKPSGPNRLDEHHKPEDTGRRRCGRVFAPGSGSTIATSQSSSTSVWLPGVAS